MTANVSTAIVSGHLLKVEGYILKIMSMFVMSSELGGMAGNFALQTLY